MNILIAGGSGFIGQALAKYLNSKGYKLFLLTRHKFKQGTDFHETLYWDGSHFECDMPFDAIINLCGENIAAKRWSKKQKEKLLSSRIISTRALQLYLRKQMAVLYANRKPPILLNASAVGFYTDSGSNQDEQNYIQNSTPNFTQKLVLAWEKEATNCRKCGVTVSCLRFGVVLDKSGGMLKKMLPSFKMGLGAIMGNGKSHLSWIHIEDLCRAVNHILAQTEIKEAYNLTSPMPCSQEEFSTQLSQAIGVARFLKIPPWLIKIIFGEMGETLMLSDQRIVPAQLKKSGFKFYYPDIQTALLQITG